jgi:hypothetical protein
MGQEYKDFKVQMKYFNFGRTIIETSPTFKTLFSILPHNLFFQIFLNYIIIVPYKGEYIQVAGRPLNEKYNMKAVGGLIRRTQTDSQLHEEGTTQGSNHTNPNIPPLQKGGSGRLLGKAYHYSTDHLHRMQIFYCSATNRNPGLFARSILHII